MVKITAKIVVMKIAAKIVVKIPVKIAEKIVIHNNCNKVITKIVAVICGQNWPKNCSKSRDNS